MPACLSRVPSGRAAFIRFMEEYIMSIIKVNRLNPFTTLSHFPTLFPGEVFEELDRFLSGMDFFDQNTQNLSISKGFPKGDLFMEGGNLIIELALAGYNKDQLSVIVEENCLIVSAEKAEAVSPAAKSRSLARRAFRKVFPQLGSKWDVSRSDVTYSDGLLRIVVPPTEPVKKEVKSIDIK